MKKNDILCDNVELLKPEPALMETINGFKKDNIAKRNDGVLNIGRFTLYIEHNDIILRNL